jgi:hypothetical protein
MIFINDLRVYKQRLTSHLAEVMAQR